MLMNSDLPEDLRLHQSGRSGPGPLGLQRHCSPGGSCSSLLSCADKIKKPRRAQLRSRSVLLLPGASGTASLQGKPLSSAGAAFPWAGTSAMQPCSGLGAALPQPPQHPGAGQGGLHPSFWEGLSEELLQSAFPHPAWLGAALTSRGCVWDGLGDASAPKLHLTCVLHGPGCHMNMFANVGL